MARKGRVQRIHDQLLTDPRADRSAVWKVVKRQKKGFQGKRTHLVVEGKPVPWSRTHEAFRDHLQNTQWKQPNIPDHTADNRRARSALRPQSRDESSFNLQDLHNVLQGLKSNKAPGPDCLVSELVFLSSPFVINTHSGEKTCMYSTRRRENCTEKFFRRSIISQSILRQ